MSLAQDRRAQDQRLQQRFVVSEDPSLTAGLELSCRTREATVHDLSLGGAGIIVDGSQGLDPGASPHLVLNGAELSWGSSPVELIHLHENDDSDDLDGGTQLLGVRYQAENEEFLRTLCSYIIARHSQRAERPRFLYDQGPFAMCEDRERVRRLLVNCCRRRRALRVLSPDGMTRGHFHPRALRNGRLAGAHVGAGVNLAPDSQYYLALSSFTTLYIFLCRYSARDGDQIAFSIPDNMLEGGIRRLSRFYPDADFPVDLEFLHPQIPGKLLCKRACELGLGGLRLPLDPLEDLLATGSVLESAILRLPGGIALPCRCVVRHTLREMDGRHFCGVELTGFGGSGRQVWVQQLLARMNPEVVAATPFTLNDAWSIFERSGYLEEKPAERIEPMRVPFLRTWRRLIGSADGGRCWFYRNEDKSIGTISVSRIYERTWLVHHMAVDRSVGAGVKLLALSGLGPRSVLQWVKGTHPDDYVLIYYDANKSFNGPPYHKFFALHDTTGKTAYQRLTLSDYQVDAFVDVPPPSPLVSVRLPTGEDLERVFGDVRARDGELFAEVLELTPRHMTGGRNDGDALWGTNAWESRDRPLDRQRTVKVASLALGGEVLAYGIAERARTGANIYSLYNTCRIVVCDQTPDSMRRELIAAIFGECVRFYREIDAPGFIVLTTDDAVELPDWAPCYQVEGYRGIVAGALVPKWAEHMNDLWAH